MKNYSNGKIYKIEPICEHDEGDIYIGSTTRYYLQKRMECHIRDYNEHKDHMITSFKLFDKYGIDNCHIVLLENVEAETKEDLLKREAHYIKTLKCVNKKVPLRTKQEYNESHREEAKLYYEKNKAKLSEKINCDCGSTYRYDHKARHCKTIKHQSYVKDNNINIINAG